MPSATMPMVSSYSAHHWEDNRKPNKLCYICISQSSPADDTTKVQVIKRILRESSGYASVSYIARQSGLEKNDVNRLLNTNDDFRKSLIKTKNGEDVYLLNAPLSGLIDLWNTFRFFSTMKY